MKKKKQTYSDLIHKAIKLVAKEYDTIGEFYTHIYANGMLIFAAQTWIDKKRSRKCSN